MAQYGVGSKNSRTPDLKQNASKTDAYMYALERGANEVSKAPYDRRQNWGKGGPAVYRYSIFEDDKYFDSIQVWQGGQEKTKATSKKYFDRTIDIEDAKAKVKEGL